MSDDHLGGTGSVEPRGVGARLRAAREAQGLSIAEVAARTRVTQRYLEAIELGRYQDLPSPTYAVGFAKAYARTVGMDEVTTGRDTRAELAGVPERRHHHIEEIADPSRAPSRGLAIVAAGVGLAVVVLALLWLSTGMFRGSPAAAPGAASTSASIAVGAPAAAPRPGPTPAAPMQASGPVVLTAKGEVWLRIYDGANNVLKQGTMQPGERFEVPANANDPQINIGRPDQIAITVGGVPMAPLGDGSRAMKDVAISAAALAARQPGAASSPAPTPAG